MNALISPSFASTFIIQLVVFLILYVILRKYVFGPLLTIMEQRKLLLASQSQAAQDQLNESNLLVFEKQQLIQSAVKEAKGLIEQSRMESLKQAEAMIQQVREEAEQFKENALRDIAAEKEKALGVLSEQVGDLGQQIADKVVMRPNFH
ncbi:F-type H+-transporting ATPase subunit b [Paenibacillus cellulosilyticus]|uniref:ATP synthase subunit b n=1 Tax=Paenibacillus cellulosilyticus TaxID=375489 RepID=A0A2V2YUW4_9BACL|nr:F0F1 ATP synthase subunit B [Paenibacillus cellulosilyticus]PWW04900.1 F-type H+-transporting ATPase subunit b [Paenibacillus cellulosilyticus]QKS46004.1 F0F1 ATP synthase subunit B [Paenibacillus cellulosilyticus]